MEFEKTADRTIKRFKAEQKEWNNNIDCVDYFMAIAFLLAKQSKDPKFQVGACIVNEKNVIVSTGYNGMPAGRDDFFPWSKFNPNDDSLYNKMLYVCHAELNAITNRNSADLRNCTLYVTLLPCNECAKLITQSGIKKVVYFSNKKSHKTEFLASRVMFKATGVDYCHYEPNQNKIEVTFPQYEDTGDESPSTSISKLMIEIKLNE